MHTVQSKQIFLSVEAWTGRTCQTSQYVRGLAGTNLCGLAGTRKCSTTKDLASKVIMKNWCALYLLLGDKSIHISKAWQSSLFMATGICNEKQLISKIKDTNNQLAMFRQSKSASKHVLEIMCGLKCAKW